MLTRLVLVTTLGLALLAPVVSAQSEDAGQGPKPRRRAAGRVLRKQVRRGVTLGKITPAGRAQLRTKVQALRAQARALRQSGQRPTIEQRQQLRTQRQQLRREIAAARRGTGT